MFHSPALEPAAAGMPDERRRLILLASATGGVGLGAVAIPFLSSFQPSERARAAGASVEVDIGDIAPGATKVVAWRGKPVWIMRRTPQMLATLAGLDAKLADPDSSQHQQPEYARNAQRSIHPEVFVGIGICTHLGCSPGEVAAGRGNQSVGNDWQGGFFCPCHGSTFDLAGRVYKNKPAPTNLEVPPHRYLSASKLLIGEEDAA